MNAVTIRREPNPLTEWTWRFWYYDRRHALVLDYYCTAERPSKRHKFRVTESYSRIDNRRHNLQESDVVLPADVIAEAKQIFTDPLRVLRWSEAK